MTAKSWGTVLAGTGTAPLLMGFKPVEHAKRAKQKTTRYAGGIKLLYKNLTFPLE